MQAKHGIRQGGPISPYLFAFIMEYLQRNLHQMQLNPDLNHHSKCEKLELTNLMFADDVLLFSKGDYISMDLTLRAFSLFAKSTCMKNNSAKSKMYLGGVDANKKLIILHKYGFSKVSLLFKYLWGSPLM